MKSPDLLIQPPPRSSLSGTGIIIINAILLSIAPFSLSARPWAAGLAVLLSAASVLVGQVQALHLSALTVLITGVPLLHPLLGKWPLILPAPVIVYFALTFFVPRLRSSLLWLRPGRFGQNIILLVFATSLISGIALYLWCRWVRPDLSIHVRSMPAMPVWVFPFAGLAFSLGNAAVEEIVFRGAVMHAMDSAFGVGFASVIIQGGLFGAMHYLFGFPNGLWGGAMAGVYGIMLGAIRRRSQGMLGPWLSHVLADIVIFSILANIALK